jgi:hypothetical protein
MIAGVVWHGAMIAASMLVTLAIVGALLLLVVFMREAQLAVAWWG